MSASASSASTARRSDALAVASRASYLISSSSVANAIFMSTSRSSSWYAPLTDVSSVWVSASSDLTATMVASAVARASLSAASNSALRF